jgi:hypothetical protein
MFEKQPESTHQVRIHIDQRLCNALQGSGKMGKKVAA